MDSERLAKARDFLALRCQEASVKVVILRRPIASNDKADNDVVGGNNSSSNDDDTNKPTKQADKRQVSKVVRVERSDNGEI